MLEVKDQVILQMQEQIELLCKANQEQASSRSEMIRQTAIR